MRRFGIFNGFSLGATITELGKFERNKIVLINANVDRESRTKFKQEIRLTTCASLISLFVTKWLTSNRCELEIVFIGHLNSITA